MSRPQNFEGIPEVEDRLYEVLLIPWPMEIDDPFFRVVVRCEEIVHMDDHAFGQQREHSEEQEYDVTAWASHMTGVDKKYVAWSQLPRKLFRFQALDRLPQNEITYSTNVSSRHRVYAANVRRQPRIAYRDTHEFRAVSAPDLDNT